MRRGSVGLVVVTGVVVLLALSGCSPDPGSASPASTAPRAATSQTPSPTPTPSATVFLGTGTPLRYSCDELVDPATIRRLDKDLTENVDYLPAASTSAERAVAIRGTACQWVDATTGTSLIVTVAHPDPPTLTDLTTTTAGYATRSSSFGNDVTAYVVNTQVEIFTRNGYWATVTSPLLSELSNAKSVVGAVADSLPAG